MGREIISGVFWGGILSAVAVSVASLMGTEGGVPFRVPVNGLPFSLTSAPEMVAEAPGETTPELSAGAAEDTPVTADVRLPGLNDGADAEEELALLAPAEGETGGGIERDDTGSPPTETASGEDAGDTSADLPIIAETPEAHEAPSDAVTADPSTNATLADGGNALAEEPAPTDSPTPGERAPVIAETLETTPEEAEDVSPVETAELPESSGDNEQLPALADASDEAPADLAPTVTATLAQLNAPLSPDTNLPTVAPETPILPEALQLAGLPSPALEIAPAGPTRSSFALAAGVAAPLSPVAGAAPQVLQRVDPSTSQPTPALAVFETVPAPAPEAEPPAPVLTLALVAAPETSPAAPFQVVLPVETPSFSSPEPDLPALATLRPDALPFLPARRLPPEHLFASGPQAPEIVDRFFLIDPPLPPEDAPMARGSAPALAQAAQSAAPSAPTPAPRALVLAAIGAPTLSPIDATPPEMPTPEPFMRVAITGPSPYGPVTPHPDLPLLPSRSANPPPPENRTPPLFAGLLGAGSRLASAPEGAEAPVLPGAFDTVSLAAPVELPASATDQAPGITDRRGFDVALTVASLTATNGAPGLPRLGASDRRLDRVALVAPQAEPEPAPIVRTAHFEPPREATADVQVGDAPATLTAREVLQSLGVVPGPEAPAPSQAELVAMARATEIPDLPQADTAPPAASTNEATQPEQTEDRPVLAALAPEATTPSRAVASEARAEQVRVNRLPTIGQQVSESAPASALEQHAARFENPDDLPVFSVILMENPDTAPEIDRIAGLPLPVSMAVDPSWPGASERAQAYRAAGLEVVILAAFKEGDVASTFATFRQALPQAVAVIETGPGAWSTNRAQVGDLVAELAGTGHGLITYPKGLNSARQLAERAEVPSGLVARAVEPDKGRDVQRRALERAAFKAARDGKAIVVGQAVDETLELLADWGTSRKTTQVALAPISQVLRAE